MKNPVGAQYIIMERVFGNELSDLWYSDTMTEKQRLKMIIEIVEMEALLFPTELPASGSIYYQHDLPPGERNVELKVAGGAGTFCIGPDAHYKWWHKERSSLSVERGSCGFSNGRNICFYCHF